MTRLLAVLIAFAGLSCAKTKPATTPPVQTSSQPAAKPTAIPEPDPAKGRPIVWIRDRYVYEEDVIQGRVGHLIAPLLVDDFVAANKLEPTEEQVKSAAKSFAKMSADNPKAGGMPEFMARQFVRGWLLDKALYERYGGAVIFQQMNPFEPVGAYRAFFEEQERLGRLKFFDPVQEEKFWAYYRQRHPLEVPKEEVDFSTPWWERVADKK